MSSKVSDRVQSWRDHANGRIEEFLTRWSQETGAQIPTIDEMETEPSLIKLREKVVLLRLTYMASLEQMGPSEIIAFRVSQAEWSLAQVLSIHCGLLRPGDPYEKRTQEVVEVWDDGIPLQIEEPYEVYGGDPEIGLVYD